MDQKNHFEEKNPEIAITNETMRDVAQPPQTGPYQQPVIGKMNKTPLIIGISAGAVGIIALIITIVLILGKSGIDVPVLSTSNATQTKISEPNPPKETDPEHKPLDVTAPFDAVYTISDMMIDIYYPSSLFYSIFQNHEQLVLFAHDRDITITVTKTIEPEILLGMAEPELLATVQQRNEEYARTYIHERGPGTENIYYSEIEESATELRRAILEATYVDANTETAMCIRMISTGWENLQTGDICGYTVMYSSPQEDAKEMNIILQTVRSTLADTEVYG